MRISLVAAARARMERVENVWQRLVEWIVWDPLFRWPKEQRASISRLALNYLQKKAVLSIPSSQASPKEVC